MTGTELTEVSTPLLVNWISTFASQVSERSRELTELDAAIGDADHGSNLDRGCQAVLQVLSGSVPQTFGQFGNTVGMQLLSAVGGSSGVLYGSFFLAFGQSGGAATGLGLAGVAEAWSAGVASIAARGKSAVGDKTMVDALQPAIDELAAAVRDGVGLSVAFERARAAAERGMRSTVPLIARKGRASYLGERSAGHIDPGAMSAWLLVSAAAEVVAS